MEQEQWLKIEEFPEYSVSEYGRVRNDDADRIMALLINQNGVVHVGLTRNRIQYKRAVSLLVANAFLPNPTLLTFDTPIHLDGDRSNNYVSNLMWRPRWFAIKYHKQFTDRRYGFSTPIREVSTGRVFRNSFEAAIEFGLLDREIMLSILNRTYVGPTFQVFERVEL